MFDRAALKRELIEDEGYELEAYLDTKGKWTIGVGHNLEDCGIPEAICERFGVTAESAIECGISPEVCDALLEHDVDIAKGDAIRFAGQECWDALSRPRRYVLMNMAFNLGAPKLGKFVNLQSALRLRDHEWAADEILDSKAAKKDAPNRYRRLAERMRMG